MMGGFHKSSLGRVFNLQTDADSHIYVNYTTDAEYSLGVVRQVHSIYVIKLLGVGMVIYCKQ